MSLLEAELRNRTAVDGPLSIANYKALCLTHPEHGYYTTASPLGGHDIDNRKGGDFITAPEISQMFGEMIGVWCMEVWQSIGSPSTFNLIELGPGRGTLMKDLLRVANAVPAFRDAARIHLVEVSPLLKEQQKLTLSSQAHLKWISDISSLPAGPCIVIANEFLDALPFHQWVKHKAKWYERAVGLIDDKIAFVLRPNILPTSELPQNNEAEPDGMIFETAPAREGTVATIANHLIENEGAALFIDYGHSISGFGDTFQAIRKHNYCAPLDAPGEADLTSHVDFQPLILSAIQSGCASPPLSTQGEFLLNLGLLERAGKLGSGQAPKVQEDLRLAVERLAGPDQMGNLFKVMAIGTPSHFAERWPGFS